MQSRRDQVQAQAFVQSRLSSALVGADPDAPDHPHRSVMTGTIVGILLTALIATGFGVYGFMRPGGSDKWQKPGVLVLEKDTGSRYIYAGGRLHPVLNTASVRLLYGRTPEVVGVSSKSLGDTPRGAAIGIVGAPDSLPADGAAAEQIWTMCAPVVAGRDGKLVTTTTLTVTMGGNPATVVLGTDQAGVVGAGREQFLLWHGRRMRITESWISRVLGADPAVVPVRTNWLNTVPAGPDLLAPDPGDRGADGPTVDGQPGRSGQLFVSPDGTRHYMLRSNGISALTPFEYALAAADPETTELYDGGRVAPATLSLAALAELRTVPWPVREGDLPDTTPAVVPSLPDGTAWCTRQPMSGGPVEIVAEPVAVPAQAATAGLGERRTDRNADAITVGAGLGGFYAAGHFAQGGGTEHYLITDAGVKYPILSEDDAGKLGYALPASPLPQELLDLIPDGPTLR